VAEAQSLREREHALFGGCLVVVGSLFSGCLVVVWWLFGGRSEGPLQVRACPVWWLCGGCLVVVWWLFGQIVNTVWTSVNKCGQSVAEAPSASKREHALFWVSCESVVRQL
jgi:hypothetical protein